MKKLLVDENALIILPTLAVAIGLNEAIFLQQLHYWLNITNFIKNGKKWIYKTLTDWEKEFPFFSTSTIKRIISALKKENILLVEKLSKDRRKRVNYYSINYQKLDNLCQKNSLKIANIELMQETNLNQSHKVNLNQSHETNLTQCIYNENQDTEITTETTTETTFFSPSRDGEKGKKKKIYKSAFKEKSSSKNRSPKIKMSWEQLDVNRKEIILEALKSVEDIALPIDEFILRLEAGGYKYLNFVSAYKSWLNREKERPQQNLSGRSSKEKITLNSLPKQEEYVIEGEW